MATLYRVTPTVQEEEVQPKNGKDFELQELYDLLGVNMIEIVRLPQREILVFDEEGLFDNDNPTNHRATELAQGHAYMTERGIVGNVLRCKSSQVK